MNFLKITIGGALATAATGTSGLLIYKKIYPETIRQRLESENTPPLSTEETSTDDSSLNSKWQAIIQKNSSSSAEISSFAGWTTEDNNQEESKIKKLKSQCQKLLDSEVSEEGLEKAKKYCLG